MTVEELIKELQKYDTSKTVWYIGKTGRFILTDENIEQEYDGDLLLSLYKGE